MSAIVFYLFFSVLSKFIISPSLKKTPPTTTTTTSDNYKYISDRFFCHWIFHFQQHSSIIVDLEKLLYQACFNFL